MTTLTDDEIKSKSLEYIKKYYGEDTNFVSNNIFNSEMINAITISENKLITDTYTDVYDNDNPLFEKLRECMSLYQFFSFFSFGLEEYIHINNNTELSLPAIKIKTNKQMLTKQAVLNDLKNKIDLLNDNLGIIIDNITTPSVFTSTDIYAL